MGRLWMPGSKLLAVALLSPPALWRRSGWRANLWVHTYRHCTSFVAWYLLCTPRFLSLRGFCCYWRYSVCFSFQVDEALTIKNTDIAKELCLPPVKLHCSSMFVLMFSFPNFSMTVYLIDHNFFVLSACRGCYKGCTGRLSSEATGLPAGSSQDQQLIRTLPLWVCLLPVDK